MADTPVAPDGDRPRRWRSLVAPAALAVIVGAMCAAMFASHRAGHWWGDDWALYIRQAQSLIDGDPGRVIADNRFTVDHSLGPAFSPPLYPWGFPIMMAPFVAFAGADVDALATVEVLCSAVFACAWYGLARRRFGVVPALVGVVAVTMTPLLVGWTELIQSEWPFLAVAFAALVWLDRLAEDGALTDVTARAWPLVLLGVAVAAAFSVRREGLAMVVAVAAAQVTALAAPTGRELLMASGKRMLLVARLLTPHSVALAVVALLQVTLPSTLVPSYAGTGLHNVWELRRRHLDHLAEVSGLKSSWQDHPVVLGSGTLGWIAVIAYLTAAAGGVVLAFTVHRRRDLHLVAYAVGAFLIGASFRSAINRYVVTVAPILLLLGLCALAWLASLVPWRHTAAVVVTVVVAMFAVGNLWQVRTRIDIARASAAAGTIEWGPTHPLALEMFEAVRSLSGDHDVVAAPKARAMALATDRRTVQVDDARPIPTDVDVALVVVEVGTELADEVAATAQTWVEVWRNPRFVIYRSATADSG